MFNFKKIVTSICAAAILATATMIPALAALKDEYTFGIKASENNDSGDGIAYITVFCDGFNGEDAYTSAGQMTYNVTKGVFNDVVETTLGSRNVNGLYAPKSVTGENGNKAVDFNVFLNQDVSDEYDVLTIIWSGGYKTYMTSSGEIVDIELSYAGEEKDAIFTADTSIQDRFYAAAVDAEKNLLANYVNLSEESYSTYKLSAGSYKVTKVEGGQETPTTPEIKDTDWTTTTDVVANPDATDPEKPNLFEGTTGSAAYAYKVNLATESGHKYMTWRVTVDGVSRGKHVDLANCKLNGEGDTQFGLAIGFTSPEEAAKLDKVEAIWGKIEKNSEGKIVNTENDNQ